MILQIELACVIIVHAISLHDRCTFSMGDNFLVKHRIVVVVLCMFLMLEIVY